MTFYRHILKSAWGKTWHYKYLWFFGLFAALLGAGVVNEIVFQILGGRNKFFLFELLASIVSSGIFSWHGLANMGAHFIREPFTTATILFAWLLFLAFVVIIIWLAVISKAALIHNTAKITFKKKHSLQDGVNAAKKYFWRFFGFILVGSLVNTAVLITFSSQMLTEIDRSNFLFKIILFFVLIPAAIIISFIINYAMAYTVIKKQKFLLAAQNAWSLFVKNWIITIEMGALILLIYVLSVVAIMVLFVFSVAPFLVFLTFFGQGFQLFVFFTILYAFFLVVAASTFFATFQTAAWTKIFLELESKGGVSKITRFFDSL